MTIGLLGADQADPATAVLCDAFQDYPVMRFVLGDVPGYPHRLRRLIGFFVQARLLKNDLILGVFDPPGTLAGVALVSLPGDRPAPAALDQIREATWQELGPSERARYEAFGEATHRFDITEPHHHLNMIGVLRSRLGRGLAKTLTDRVHQLAAADPTSGGVSLSTEAPANVALYEHLGYRLLGHARVSRELETWAFFRPNP